MGHGTESCFVSLLSVALLNVGSPVSPPGALLDCPPWQSDLFLGDKWYDAVAVVKAPKADAVCALLCAPFVSMGTRLSLIFTFCKIRNELFIVPSTVAG